MRASLVSRDWIADSVELVMRAQCYDGLLAIAGCDKSIPGMLLAIVRLDVPAVFAYGGSLAPGRVGNRDISLQDVYEAIGARSQGLISNEQLETIEKAACPGIGTCAGMFSANTMASVAEALGLTVPGMAAPPAAAADRLKVLHDAADALLNAVHDGIRPSDVLTRQSLENATAIASALGGSTNACLHLLAIAAEAKIDFTLADIDTISRRTPQLADMKPAGRFMMRELHLAGGVPAVMRELLSAGLLHGEAMAISGRTIAEQIASFPSGQPHPVLRTIARPVKARGGYAIVSGSLAPDGAVTKIANEGRMYHRGPARCFDSEQDGANAAGSPQAAVTIIVLAFKIGGNIGYHDGAYIEDQVPKVRQSQDSHVVGFHYLSKKIQGDHIESEVEDICVDQCAGKEPIILVAHTDRWGPEDQVIHDAGVVEGGDGNEGGKDYNTKGNREH